HLQDRDVALGQWLEAMRMVGRTRPVLFSALADMGIHADRLTVLGHLDEPTPIEHETWRFHGWTFAITEA
ncbi:MAG: hypothetical protein AB7P02_19335, partial [Alphaproteobacteria bacterium]